MSRDLMRPSPRRCLALAALLSSGACMPVAILQADREALLKELDIARARVHCDPVALALAEANLTFADVELDEGDARRALEHLTEGRSHAEIASACPADAPPTRPEVITPIKTEPPKPATPTDKDGDGIPDADDECPNDPEDLDGFKDADGCPDLDNDNDGVPDSADRCPLQAEDRDGFQDEDGCPDPDNDGDGVPDAQDQCPNEAGSAMERGCPSRDRDHDGIGDEIDQCPDQPETFNGYLDMDGCPDEKPSRVEITSEQIVIKERINFATGKDVILPSSFPVLDDVAQVLKDYPRIKVEIGGHTDNVGDDNANQKLSKNRADSVFEYLLAKGVQANRMVTIGYGETRPIDTNRTEEGRTNNRRVEFIIIGGGLNQPSPDAPAPTPDTPSPWQ